MREIDFDEARAGLPRLMDEVARGEAFVIVRNGRKEAVLVSWDAWLRVAGFPSFGQLLRAAPPGLDELPERDQTPPRETGL